MGLLLLLKKTIVVSFVYKIIRIAVLTLSPPPPRLTKVLPSTGQQSQGQTTGPEYSKPWGEFSPPRSPPPCSSPFSSVVCGSNVVVFPLVLLGVARRSDGGSGPPTELHLAARRGHVLLEGRVLQPARRHHHRQLLQPPGRTGRSERRDAGEIPRRSSLAASSTTHGSRPVK